MHSGNENVMFVNEWESSATLGKDSSVHKFQTLCIRRIRKQNEHRRLFQQL